MPTLIRRFLPLAVAALLLAAGCCQHRQAAIAPPPDTPAPQAPRAFRTANFTCAVEGFTANGQLRMAEDSILWVSVSKIVELGRAVATPDSVIVYAKVLGRCFQGSYDDVYRRFHYRTSFAELQAIANNADASVLMGQVARQFGIAAEFRFQSWRDVAKTTFPIEIPLNVKPL